MPTLDPLNLYAALAVLALAGGALGVLQRLLAVQRQQLRLLEALLAEQRAAHQHQLALEQARVAEAQASQAAAAAHAQQVVASRQTMADAVASLRQLKRQFA